MVRTHLITVSKLKIIPTVLIFLFMLFSIFFLPGTGVTQQIDDSIEFNNDAYTSPTLVSSGLYSNLKCLDDDWYQITVPNTGNLKVLDLKVAIEFAYQNGDLDLKLYSKNVIPDATNYLDSSALVMNTEVVSASVPPGDYLIRVYGYKGAINNNYTMRIEFVYPCQEIPYNWMEINNTGEELFLGDNEYINIPLGFNFLYFNQAFPSITISANGYLTFSNNGGASAPLPAKHNNAPTNSIFTYWMNLRSDLGGSIFYLLDDSDPNNKKFIVEWKNIPSGALNGEITFQAILSERTNQILFQYEDALFSSSQDNASYGLGATIGITNGLKTNISPSRLATQLPKDPPLKNNQALVFTPSFNNPFTMLTSSPSHLSTGIPTNQTIKIVFSQYIDSSTISNVFSLNPQVTGTWQVDPDHQNWIVYTHPAQPFNYGTPYTVTFTPGQIKDIFGNTFSGGVHTISFTTTGNGIIPPDISVSYPTNNFGDVTIGNHAAITLNVSNASASTENLTVTAITSSSPVFAPDTTSFTLAPGASKNVILTFTPSSAGPASTTLSISSNDPDESPFIIVFQGNGTNPPIQPADISVSYPTNNFGDVTIGNHAAITLNVSNASASTENLTVTAITSSSPVFAPDTTSFTLAPGASKNVILTFTPSSAGPASTTLSISSNDPDESPLTPQFIGNGSEEQGEWTVYWPQHTCPESPIITALVLDKNGTIWVGTQPDNNLNGGGVCALSIYSNVCQCLDKTDGLLGNRVVDITTGGPCGDIWVATEPDSFGGVGAGVSRYIGSGIFESYDPLAMGFFNLNSPFEDYGLLIYDMAVDNNCDLWVATLLSGIFHFNHSTKTWTNYSSYGLDLFQGQYIVQSDNITSIYVDSQGILWIGTEEDGIFAKKPDGSFLHIDEDDTGEWIEDMVMDNQGNLWIAGTEGLLMLPPPYNTPPILPANIPLDLTNYFINPINSLFLDSTTNKLFIATDQGFYLYDGNKWTHYDMNNSSIPALSISSILVDPYHDYWIGTKTDGLAYYNSGSPQIVTVNGDNNSVTNLPAATKIYVKFSEPMDSSSTQAAFTMKNFSTNASISGSYAWDDTYLILIFSPSSPLAYETRYTIIITNNAKDRAGFQINLGVPGATSRTFDISTMQPTPPPPDHPTQNYSSPFNSFSVWYLEYPYRYIFPQTLYFANNNRSMPLPICNCQSLSCLAYSFPQAKNPYQYPGTSGSSFLPQNLTNYNYSSALWNYGGQSNIFSINNSGRITSYNWLNQNIR